MIFREDVSCLEGESKQPGGSDKTNEESFESVYKQNCLYEIGKMATIWNVANEQGTEQRLRWRFR